MSSFPTTATSACPTPLLPLVGADVEIPLVDGRTVRHANFDGAASAPASVAVAQRVTDVLPWYASVHRGAGYASQVSTALYERAREDVGRFVGARPDDVTIITRNTTDALNLLASAVPGRVLTLDVEHHANLLPWDRSQGGHEVVRAQPTVAGTLSALQGVLAARRFALLAVTGTSNVTGESLPLAAVVDLAHRYGCRIVVDGAQLLAHRRLSLEDSGVDYVAFSGHKLYAPFGAGALVGRRDWLDHAAPHLAGGGAVRQVSSSAVQWATSPARHEGGTPNLVGVVAMAAAAAELSAVPDEELRQHEEQLHRALLDGLRALPEVDVARIWVDSAEPVGVVTFRLRETDPGLLAAFLAAEHGVSVRDGRFCAHPLLDRLGWGAGAVRASIGIGTTGDDVDRLLAGLQAWVAGDQQARYAQEDGVWVVVDDPRPTPSGIDLVALAATAGVCS
ncbi:aminotransferase class V-fold PLP-dependent enzyme [Aeromicrobium endophyticum]|uniref:Aminotransferase class V-fold PLP-dependent enzyme n=1 Tax=Aeromicrobium endophyticum TaxID=2292704 RepID=A0A371PAP6_9ACTN|nr:aminotransferase class V-fold PLP-dependent enzyme [Aeromicrobium endophyticum]REK72971.1 aminotransferase class V-fold PLP-dependent enzyme [Aeromicrobium endophyticum]